MRYQFPEPSEANEDGLIAIGGNLSIDCLLSAYKNGIFPWFNAGDPILWWSPNPRMVIYPKQLHLPRSVKKAIKKTSFKFSFDLCFEQVIKNCAAPRISNTSQPGTWISEEMIEAYIELHIAGYAHSVECWQNSKLCGGLYGVALGSVFFGESMFSQVSESSKLSLITLTKQLQIWEYYLLDCQLASELVQRLGAQNLPRKEFTKMVRKHTSYTRPESWSGFQPISLL